MTHRILDRVPSAAEHAALAAAVGWQSHFDEEVRAASLRASLAGVVCVDASGEVVGMARAVGDGLQYAYVQDVIVHPEHEGSGIATRMVERLLELLQPEGDVELFVGLFASDAAVGVYESLGFTAEDAVGMHRRLRGDAS
ncbi:GNAT family N-acetyltransferase [Leucobacter chromiiresistens]|uniref:GNAT family N-acetyltransferase n=1 Tax=Leucobacter chromiiresistens TaxID=1079994 RepID=UPI000734727C|nr:GNAT family N-acetyltransferase [Leucobacter chromiiresistens]